ncbi:hypothetical protein O0I10_001213 [Lichtheimia ornata]|uniref:DUF2421 domain-containing protein n=1 Tax=Lichtheimia ornata TaxID=688661 RepID=A0AAD7Y3D8_9FUNG|nr:uncharacterized protein O0I10_001213 [Lichtheimia ornata]KAJ8663036.1 hypothetical protein O0I10_001213 [Lichtheimia ornata]
MCSVATGWSLLGIYCASLVRVPDSTDLAQTKVCAVLACFLLIGAFCLNFLRARVDQANLGGMLSATILVITLTGAVRDQQYDPTAVLQDYIPILGAFVLVFLICVLVWPENSTCIYVQQLVKTIETFDGIAQRQVDSFLHSNKAPREQSVYPSRSSQVEPLPVVQRTLESLLQTLVEKKRVVRREVTFSAVAPRDVSEITRLMKKMRVPLQGIGLSRTIEDNMRKALTRRHIANRLKKFATLDSLDPISNPAADPRASYSGQSFSTVGSDNPCWTSDDDDDDEGDDASTVSSSSSTCSSTSSSSSSIGSQGTHDDNNDDDLMRPSTSTQQTKIPSPYEECGAPNEKEVDDSSDDDDDEKEQHDPKAALRDDDHGHGNGFFTPEHITITLPPESPNVWRREYDEILETVRPIYRELSQACSTAAYESTLRLNRMQRGGWGRTIRHIVGKGPSDEEYARDHDPSVPLLKAIRRFDSHRLTGLQRLYHEDVPRRILFMLLHFQFNLRGYAERVYTLSSLVYEMDQVRTRRRVWLPHMSLRKWLGRKNDQEDVGLDPPAQIVETHVYESAGLQRSLSRRATTILNELEALPDLAEPMRGQVPTPNNDSSSNLQQRKRQSSSNGGGTAPPRFDPTVMYHDPDVAYPTTRTQRAFYTCWQFCKANLYSADTTFAVRACIVLMALTLPAFLDESIDWYNRARGQWAAVVALVWMGPSVGSNFFGLMVRTVGTFIGAICSLLIWEISRTNRAAMVILVFVFNLPWWLVYLNGKFWKATGLFSLITTSIIVGYAYHYKMSGAGISVYEVTYERTISVLAGVVAALVISVFPYPRTGRVELRHRISRTLGDVAALYSSFLALLLKNSRRDENVRKENRKVFRCVAADIRKQIKGALVLLEQSRFEPALRGVFQEHKYLQILQVLENMVNLMIDMEHALERIHEHWRLDLVRNTWKERKNAIASFLTALHLGANALSNKSPLPPYILRPTRARRILTNKARLIPNLMPEHLADPEYTYYSAYLMSSEQLAVEIELLISTIRDLVGPDSVSVWLDYRH